MEDVGTFGCRVLALLLSHGEATQSLVDLLIVVWAILYSRVDGDEVVLYLYSFTFQCNVKDYYFKDKKIIMGQGDSY